MSESDSDEIIMMSAPVFEDPDKEQKEAAAQKQENELAQKQEEELKRAKVVLRTMKWDRKAAERKEAYIICLLANLFVRSGHIFPPLSHITL